MSSSKLDMSTSQCPCMNRLISVNSLALVCASKLTCPLPASHGGVRWYLPRHALRREKRMNRGFAPNTLDSANLQGASHVGFRVFFSFMPHTYYTCTIDASTS